MTVTTEEPAATAASLSTLQLQTDRTADIVERRVVTAAQAIQQQFAAITRLIDQRVESNKDQSDAKIEAVEKSSQQRKEVVETAIRALDNVMSARFEAVEKAREIQAAEYARRLEILNHAHERATDVQKTYVSREIYSKDWDRLYSERTAERAQLAANDVIQQTAADTARRNTTLGLISGFIALFSVAVSIFLHYSTLK